MTQTRARRSGPRLEAFLLGPAVRRAALIAFLALAALLGGGARADIVSLIALRPLAVAFGCYALLAMPAGALANVRAPLLLVLAAFGVVAWQLIPLPPGIWHLLPGHEPMAKLDSLLGFEHTWRPAALSPGGAWNALFALTIPLAGLLLYATLEPGDRRLLPGVVVAVAACSALLGILQMLGNPEGPLYFYSITNGGTPVGLFANRNHHAVFLAAAMPIAAVWASNARGGRTVAAWGAVALFLAVTVVSGSRAGAALAIPGFAAAAWLLLQLPLVKASPQRRAQALPRAIDRRTGIALAAIGLVLVAGMAWLSLSQGQSGLAGMLAVSQEEEVRYRALPTVVAMLGTYWLTGAGGGSFPVAFNMVEPTELLNPYYLNHAHNDWLEVPIEYGVPGLLLLVAFLLLAARNVLQVWRDTHLARSARAAVIAPMAIFALASLVDYPLRVPSLGAMMLLWLVAAADHRRALVAPDRKAGTWAQPSSVYPQQTMRYGARANGVSK